MGDRVLPPPPPPAQKTSRASEQRETATPSEQHPVAFGLVALLGVGLAIGLIAAVVALAASKMVVGGGEEVAQGATSQQSMYVPSPSDTGEGQDAAGPLLQAEQTKPKQGEKDRAATEAISLQAGQTSVGPMERIDLTGTYQGGEGAVLQVQRFASGSWGDFPVTVSVSGGTFSTYVQTSTTGAVKFRVVDSDTGKESNEVSVQIG